MDDSKNVLPQVVENVRNNDNQHTEYNEHSLKCNNQDHYKRNLICFWMIGLCSGFGGTVMWSATFDILKGVNTASV